MKYEDQNIYRIRTSKRQFSQHIHYRTGDGQMMTAIQDNDEEPLTELGLEECVESGMRGLFRRLACAGERENKASRSVFLSACRYGCMIKLQLILLVDAPTFRLYPAAWSHGGPKRYEYSPTAATRAIFNFEY